MRRAWMDWLLVATCWAAVAAWACGAELISGPTKSEPYRMLDHAVAGDWESAIWSVVPEKADVRTSSDGKTLTWVAPPGQYTVEAILVNFSAKKIQRGKLSVTIGQSPQPDPQPNPNPHPNPQPEPQPNPTPTPPDPKDLWCVIVEESSQRTPAHATVILSADVRREIADGQFRVADKDTPVAAGMQSYVDRAKGRTLPQMILAGKNGAILWEGNLPATVGETVALIQKIKRGDK